MLGGATCCLEGVQVLMGFGLVWAFWHGGLCLGGRGGGIGLGLFEPMVLS